MRIVVPLPRPWLVTQAALIETTHLLGNHPRALAELRAMLADLRHESPEPAAVIALMERWASSMDYADACAVLLAKTHKGSVVVTTDHQDFATYKVPFISPRGQFHI